MLSSVRFEDLRPNFAGLALGILMRAAKDRDDRFLNSTWGKNLRILADLNDTNEAKTRPIKDPRGKRSNKKPEIIRLLLEGKMSNKEISLALGVSPGTISGVKEELWGLTGEIPDDRKKRRK